MTRGDIIVISGPSGSGKTTIYRALLSNMGGLAVSVSYTTREKRAGETEGLDYYYVDEQGFGNMIKCNEFLECAKVFGNWYGTSRSVTEAIISAGNDALLEIDVQGGSAVKAAVPEAVLIGILPPDRETLRQRLFNRARDSREDIERRLEEAWKETAQLRSYDYIVVNKDLDTAIREVECIVTACRLRGERAQDAVNAILQEKGDVRKWLE